MTMTFSGLDGMSLEVILTIVENLFLDRLLLKEVEGVKGSAAIADFCYSQLVMMQ
jgi:hypothetical protein